MSIKTFIPRPRGRKNVLIVNCYLDDSRQSIARTHKIPPAMGPVYLAGAFSPNLCEVRLYNEQSSGPLEDEKLLGWPDMLVFTGVNTSLDRMKQLTAYGRTKNPRLITVAGGPPIRALPRYSSRFFDYCCTGDIEQLQEVIRDAFGKEYATDEMTPRFDLANWIGKIGYAESTRYCNFHCAFCSLTGEGRSYRRYSLDYTRRQIVALGKRKYLFFIDNNFYGNDRNHFLARLELLREMRAQGYFESWGALVTNDFFFKEENLKRARESGCSALFSGVESFDSQWLRSVQKTQNTTAPQVEMIRKCLEHGIVFLYGLILDPGSRPLRDLRRELEFITTTPEITLPSFVTLAIPLLGTPYFHQCLGEGRFLPLTKVRDLNSQTVSTRPVDPIEEVADFARKVQSLEGFRGRILKHAAGFVRRYRSALRFDQMMIVLGNSAYFSAHHVISSPSRLGVLYRAEPKRTNISTTEILDPVYRPLFRVDSRYESYFKPTMLTDIRGQLSSDLADDLGHPQKTRKRFHG